MRANAWIVLPLVLGCGSATGMMAETDASSSGTDGSSGSGDTTGATMTTSPTTTSPTTTSPMTTTESPTTTTADPDSSTTDEPGTESTGGCPPGTLDCPCDIGSACEGELICDAGVCVAEPACEQPDGEPNDDEASAAELPGTTCGDDAVAGAGAFDGAETDWFVYRATQAPLCPSNPAIEVDAPIDVASCAFIGCVSGSPNVFCQGGSDPVDSPEGLPGCCNQNGVELAFNCTFGSPTADIFVQLTATDAACTPYDFTYSY